MKYRTLIPLVTAILALIVIFFATRAKGATLFQYEDRSVYSFVTVDLTNGQYKYDYIVTFNEPSINFRVLSRESGWWTLVNRVDSTGNYPSVGSGWFSWFLDDQPNVASFSFHHPSEPGLELVDITTASGRVIKHEAIVPGGSGVIPEPGVCILSWMSLLLVFRRRRK